jgi:hypothetical protein
VAQYDSLNRPVSAAGQPLERDLWFDIFGAASSKIQNDMGDNQASGANTALVKKDCFK